MNGVDVSRVNVGDVMELSDDRAEALIDSGWAEPVPPDTPVTHNLLSSHPQTA
jgi:hypothetical protein